MLTGPRINTDDITPSCGFFLPAEEKKYIQYSTIIYSRQYLCVGSSSAKNALPQIIGRK
jgi:hypothetical protein